MQVLLRDSHLPALQSQRIQQASLPKLPSFQPQEQPERRVWQERRTSVVQKMKDAGFTMLMDDFGSGYSSLNMLQKTQFDVLKIDRGFLSEFMESSRGRKIISHTISMSRDIGLDIIAEGVETPEQASFLSDCGCDSAQGFYYSKPITQEEFDKMLVEVNK